MSKRYREVLEEVETPATRQARRRTAVPDVAPDAVEAPTATPPTDPAGGGGGTATLVRPTRTTTATSATTVAQRPVTMRGREDEGGGRRPGSRPGTRSGNHPGNGPSDADEPLAFAWRGRHYEVTRILGHWREEEGWWRRPDGEPIRIEQSDLWRVEATRGGPASNPAAGVYELARRGQVWRLDRVWD